MKRYETKDCVRNRTILEGIKDENVAREKCMELAATIAENQVIIMDEDWRVFVLTESHSTKRLSSFRVVDRFCEEAEEEESDYMIETFFRDPEWNRRLTFDVQVIPETTVTKEERLDRAPAPESDNAER